METNTVPEAKLEAAAAQVFILAGKAIFTLRSTKTGTRYTYKVCKAEAKPGWPDTWFVKYLAGSDNDADYMYLGMIRNGQFTLTAKSRVREDSLIYKAFAWTFGRMMAGQDTSAVEVWHASRCGRCGRTLTVPESIATGLGPECAAKMGF